jgi:hypothetical protein
MRRSLWFVAGASAGVYAAARARRAAEVLTVDGLRDRVGAIVVGARMLRDEAAQGRAEAESELRERIGVGLDRRRALLAAPTTESVSIPETPEPHDQEESPS